MEMKTEEIKVKSNPRKDFGNMTELVESIRQHGIIEPLIVNKEGELIAGERRLKAAKSLGIEKVPVRIMEPGEAETEEIKIIENIQRKDLTPVEEGTAFERYVKHIKCSAETLAKKIGKTTQYVERRIMLPKLIEEAGKALEQGEIKMGHATVLAQLDEAQQAAGLKAIKEGRYNPKEFATFMRWNDKIDLAASGEVIELPTQKKGQTILTDVGAKLPDANEIMQSKAFAKDLNAYVESEKRRLMKQGIQVVSKQHVQTKYPHAELINTWDSEYKKAIIELPKSKDYAVIVDWNGSYLRTEVVRLTKKKEEKKEQAQMTKKKTAAAEKALNLSREQKLQNRIDEFKKKFKVTKIDELISPATKLMKAMNLYAMVSNAPFRGECTILSQSLLKEMGFTKGKYDYKPVVNLTKILAMDEKTITGFIDKAAKLWIHDIWGNDLDAAAKEAGVDVLKHFKLSEEYLNIYSKEQLSKLAKEFKVKLEPDGNKASVVKQLMKDAKQQIPKEMLKV